MPVRPYQATTLWKSSLADRKEGDPHQRERDHLRLAYEDFRSIAADLTNEIHRHLPNLTVHNIDHLDALWDVASEILGPDCNDINPMEAFVLGGAFLLHDAGMALAAFPGRMTDLKREVRWRDAVVAAYRRRGVTEPSEEEFASLTRVIEEEVAFDVLRALHAEKAEALAHMSWRHPSTGTEMPMLADTALRQAHGDLIGKIAASHHWDVEDIPRRFGDSLLPPTNPYPREWTIDPIKLACILRCADAANIDETRAPSYLYAMRRPDGVSDDHWGFQNQLLAARRNGDALEFRSKRPFDDTQATKWWLAHDCIRYLDSELARCAALLEDMRRKAFPTRRVASAGNPNRLKQYIEVRGWTPVNTDIRVTNVKTLVEHLGGKQLYGDNPIVPLRELIQNAADAIRARRVLDAEYTPTTINQYPGQIAVRVAEDPDDRAKVWFSVEDDGIGMTQRVLTGHLLDFGKSLWRSDEVTEIYPGLSGSDAFHPTGQYGIGFFSAFMYSDCVRVISKPWRAGDNELQTLTFPNGLSNRGSLRQYEPGKDGPLKRNISTKVSVRIPKDKYVEMRRIRVQDYPTLHNHQNASRDTPSLACRLARICITLGVSILVEDEEGIHHRAHQPSYLDMDGAAFLSQLLMLKDEKDAVLEMASLLRPLQDEAGRNLGRAAIATHAGLPFHSAFAGGIAVGGFLAERDGSANRFVGVLEGAPISAVRSEGTTLVPTSVMRKWASEQARLIATSGLTEYKKFRAAVNVCSYGGDASPTAYIFYNGALMSLRQGIELLGDRKLMKFIVEEEGHRMFIAEFPSEYDITGFSRRDMVFVDTAMESKLAIDVCHADIGVRLFDRSYYYASEHRDTILGSQGFLRYFVTGAEDEGMKCQLSMEQDQLLGHYQSREIRKDLLVLKVIP